MRRKRNDAFYDIALITETEAEEAVITAERYLAVVTLEVAALLK
jgi:hypothetical protein